MNLCDSSPCKNGGRCLSLGNFYLCECSYNFIGTDCDLERNCGLLSCKNGGTCISINLSHECSCQKGYTGRYCEKFNPLGFTSAPRTTTAITKSESHLSATLGYAFGVVVLGLLFSFACWRVKKKGSQRWQHSADHAGNIELGNRDPPTNIQIFRLTSLTEHFHQQLHLRDSVDVEIRVDGTTVSSAHDPTRDLPPSYLSVVDLPTFTSDDDSKGEPPPSYNEAIEAASLPAATTTVEDTMSEQDSNVTS